VEDEKSGNQEGIISVERPDERAEETPFDQLESRIDVLIEKYEKLRSEHSSCGQQLATKEARIRELEAKLENLEKQRSEIRSRLGALIDKLGRFS
jgi:septal ring factor EnvC (AmiA/AmiB activator)